MRYSLPPSAGNMWLSPGAGGAHKAQVEVPELVLGRVRKYFHCRVGLSNQGQVISCNKAAFPCGMACAAAWGGKDLGWLTSLQCWGRHVKQHVVGIACAVT